MRHPGQRLHIRQKQTNKKTIYSEKKMFCSNISYSASNTSSPSAELIMLAMQYLKGTLYCNLPPPLLYTCTFPTAQTEFDKNIQGRESRRETSYL